MMYRAHDLLTKLSCVTAIAALLGGCLFSPHRVVDRGADIGIAEGRWQCDDTTETTIVAKRNEGTPGVPDIVYQVDQQVYRLEATGHGLYLAQELSNSDDHSFAFIEVLDGGQRIRMFGRDPDKPEVLRTIAARHRVKLETYEGLGVADARLVGSPADVRALLVALDRSVLSDLGTCRRE